MTAAEELVKEFISEDDLQTFEGWLKYHGDAALTAPEDLETRAALLRRDEGAHGGEPQGRTDEVPTTNLR